MENGMNGDEYRRHHSRSRSPSPSLNRSNSRGSMNRDGRSSSLVRRNAKQIRFYRNGDKFFRGLKLAVSAERYKEFDALCAELSSKLDLPSGAVRFIFEAESGKEVRDVSELEYGSSYCCGSAPSFKAIPGGYGRPHHSWSVNSKNPENKAITNWDRKVVQCQQSTNKDFIKPKLVTIIKNGKPPQKKVTMLLNQKTALHLDQVLDHLSAKGTLGKVDKLCTCDCKQIRELRDLFNDDMIFIACCATERFPEDGFEVDVHRKRPPWNFSTVPATVKYIPGLPTEKHLTKVFTVHIHCLLAASMPAAENNLTPRSTARSSRARSVSPRLYLPQRPKSASPMRNKSPVPPRPKTAPRPSSRPKQFSMKPLTPRKVSETSPMKAVSKPKAGSDKPVAIRPRRLKKLPENDLAEENVEDVRAKHGYFVYVYNDQFRGDPGHTDSRPMASVKPMIAIQVLDDDTNDKENSENKDCSTTQDDLDKSDLKPLTLSVSPTGSMDAILP